MTIGDQPAFPVVMFTAYKPGYMDTQTAIPGMTYRQWLVGQIAQGYASNPHVWEEWDRDNITDGSLALADAIIARMDGEGE